MIINKLKQINEHPEGIRLRQCEGAITQGFFDVLYQLENRQGTIDIQFFYDIVTDNPADLEWYLKAFEDFKKDDKNLQYAASYSVSDKQLKKILWPIIAKINTQQT